MSLRNKSKVSKNSDLTREVQDAASKIWTEKKKRQTALKTCFLFIAEIES